MSRRTAWIAVLLLSASASASCEENQSQCGAACLSSTTLRLYRAEWATGQHVVVVRYPRHDGLHEVSCIVDLPSTDSEIDCTGDADEPNDPKWVWVSVDATLDVRIDQLEPGEIELEVVPPEGESRTKTVQPAYSYHEVCGQSCATGDEVVDLDE